MMKFERLYFRPSFIAAFVAELFGIFVPSVVWGTPMPTGSASIQHRTDPEKVEFATDVLNLKQISGINISRFSSGNYISPGKYQAGVWLNGVFLGNQDIEVKSRTEDSTYVCISPKLLSILPLAWDRMEKGENTGSTDPSGCSDVLAHLSESRVSFDSGEQRLDISLPQKYVRRQARGSVSSDLWDKGVPAAFLSYNLNTWASQSRGYDYKSLYASVSSGLNIGAWYFRHNGAYTWSEEGEKGYKAINSYVQRDIPALKGRLLLGQSNTAGRLFDTVPFSGAQIASDERMYPESQRGYAPEIRGIARTNARVTVRQSDQIIYETTVSPGEFVIDDLYPTGYGGDLTVTVREADGQEHFFLVHYAAMPQLLRPGSYRYSLTAGQIRQITLTEKPRFLEATWQQGLTNYLTGYLGWQQSEKYYAAQAGIAVGTPVGAISIDATQSHTTFDGAGGNSRDKASSGQSYRLSYSKIIEATGTNFTLAAYRFSTEGYYDLPTALMTREAFARGYTDRRIKRAKSRYSLTAGQSLPQGWGQFYVSASVQNYWNSDDTDKQYQLGYSNYWKSVTFGINLNRTYTMKGDSDTSWLLSVSFPLGDSSEKHIPNMRLDAGRNADGSLTESASISGNGGSENQYSYGLTARNTSGGVGSSLFVNGQWRTPYTYLNANASTGRHAQSQSVGISGSLIAHSGGVTLSSYNSDTWAIIEAKGAKGARVSSFPGIHVDGFGYAAVPYLNAYQLNEMAIDPKDAENDVGFESTSRKVAPYSGAIVKVVYDTQTGIPILITASWKNEPVPFGSDIVDRMGNYLATAGQSGQIFMRLEPGQHVLRLKAGNQGSCSMKVSVPEKVPASGILKKSVPCN